MPTKSEPRTATRRASCVALTVWSGAPLIGRSNPCLIRIIQPTIPYQPPKQLARFHNLTATRLMYQFVGCILPFLQKNDTVPYTRV